MLTALHMPGRTPCNHSNFSNDNYSMAFVPTLSVRYTSPLEVPRKV